MKHASLSLLAMAIVLSGCQFTQDITFSPGADVTPESTLVVSTQLPPESIATVTLMSDFPGVVSPEPGARLTTIEYKNLAPSIGWGATVPGICMSISPIDALEPGDFPTLEEWLDWMHFSIDGKVVDEFHSLLLTDSKGIQAIDPTTGQVLFQEPAGSPLMVCYAASLGIGTHTAQLVVKKTPDKEISYTWQFTITE